MGHEISMHSSLLVSVQYNAISLLKVQVGTCSSSLAAIETLDPPTTPWYIPCLHG